MHDIFNGLKTILKQFLKIYLKLIVKLTLARHQPLVIAVTGSSNEVFTKNSIKNELQKDGYQVRSNPKNFNTEIGLPLAILNLPSGYNSYRKWLPIIGQAVKKIFDRKFPKILIIELGVSQPGDMRYLMSLIKPQIAVITDITQRYVESFSDMDELVGEYEHFIKLIDKKGYIILNTDNLRIKKLVSRGRATVITFGMAENGGQNYWRGTLEAKTLKYQKIKIQHGPKTEEYILNCFGQHHIYAKLAGLIVKDIIANFK